MKVHRESRYSTIDVVEQNLEIQWTWVEACRRGDAGAWRRLHSEYFDFVYRMARRLGTPSAELDDVCQETFVIAFKKLSDFREGHFTTWLYRIVANIVSGRVRRNRIRNALSVLWGAPEEDAVSERTPEDDLGSVQAEQCVNRLVSKLSPKKREVLVLYELEGLSGQNIATLIGCSIATVWTRLHYARKELETLARAEGIES